MSNVASCRFAPVVGLSIVKSPLHHFCSQRRIRVGRSAQGWSYGPTDSAILRALGPGRPPRTFSSFLPVSVSCLSPLYGSLLYVSLFGQALHDRPAFAASDATSID